MTSNGKADKYYLIGSETFGCILNYARDEFWFIGGKGVTVSRLSLADDYLENHNLSYKEVAPDFITFLMLKYGVEKPSWK